MFGVEREEKKKIVELSETIYDRDGNVEKVRRWIKQSFSSSFPSAVRDSKKRSKKKKKKKKKKEDDDGGLQQKQQLTPKSTPPMLVFNFERLF